MKHPSAYIRATAFAFAAATMISGSAAQAQSPQPVANITTPGVSTGECGAFTKYMAQEARDFGGKLSATFLDNSLRFLRAGCKPFDKDGEIQIITRNDQDGASLGTALRRMNKFDILGISGVKHCHRPDGGTCTITTGSTNLPTPARGG
jgi:hypothetical protein